MKAIYFLSLNMISFVPYAFGFLKSYAQQDPLIAANYRWHPPLTTPAPTEAVADAIVDPDLLCLSCYVWNHNQQMAIAQRVKARYPHCLVVCGGPHVPDRVEDFFTRHPQADVLVHGEGEVPFAQLLKALLAERPDLGQVAGISFNRSDRCITTAPGARLGKDLPVPSPYLNGNLDGFLGETNGGRIALNRPETLGLRKEGSRLRVDVRQLDAPCRQGPQQKGADGPLAQQPGFAHR